MKVCVCGLWHLGTVTAACLASAGHHVSGLDFQSEVVAGLQQGRPPIFEPGLEELVKKGLAEGRLSFSSDPAEALRGAEVAWVAYDTPVDEHDHADVEHVFERVQRIFPYLEPGVLVLVSSQVPVGTTGRLERAYQAQFPSRQVSFGYSPENLRLGKAISVFTQPDRVVVGVRDETSHRRIAALLQPFTTNLEVMSVESAEMTKHAINAFLATSVTFINEIAVLCEQVGADAKEVERGLKSEARIGPRAYLSPGGSFAGGTLARDIAFLNQLGKQMGVETHLLSSVRASNQAHALWARRKLEGLPGGLPEQRIAVWGLTYKPGTDTLRRSSAVELCRWLAGQGAHVQAYDPAVKSLPPDLQDIIHLYDSPTAALAGVAALVVATEWPEFQSVALPPASPSDGGDPEVLRVIDANRFLLKTLGSDPRIQYFTVGKAVK